MLRFRKIYANRYRKWNWWTPTLQRRPFGRQWYQGAISFITMSKFPWTCSVATDSWSLRRAGCPRSCKCSTSRKERHIFDAPNMTPALLSLRADIVEYRVEDASLVDPSSPEGYVERFIHGEIYRRYQTVNSVIHSHAAAIVPFSVTGMFPTFTHIVFACLRPPRMVSHFLQELICGRVCTCLDS